MKSDDYNVAMFIVAIIIFLLACFAVFASSMVGRERGRQDLQTEAVTLGHAQWSVSTNGTTSFQWKTNCP